MACQNSFQRLLEMRCRITWMTALARLFEFVGKHLMEQSGEDQLSGQSALDVFARFWWCVESSANGHC